MKIAVILALFLAVASAQYYSEPDYKTSESYSSKRNYNFDWEVKDDSSYNNFAHSEKSEGNVVTGSYRVALPDGRTQIVTYKADSNGYVADVKYENTKYEVETKYPEYKQSYYSYSTETYNAPAVPHYQPPTASVYAAPGASTYYAPFYESIAAYTESVTHLSPAAPTDTRIYRDSSASQKYSTQSAVYRWL